MDEINITPQKLREARKKFSKQLETFCVKHNTIPIMGIVIGLSDGGIGLFTNNPDMSQVIAELERLVGKLKSGETPTIKDKWKHE